jgi:hypothetical protein
MKKIFVSYRHVDPDQAMAQSLTNHLQKRGNDVFVDTQILVGTKWVDEIDRQIRTAEFFVVLISGQSILSDMVRREIKLAHQLSQKATNPLAILPIRIDFEAELPYDLGAYLDPIQYTKWKSGESYERVIGQITAAIEQANILPEPGKKDSALSSSPGLQALANATEISGAPLPCADPRFAAESGTIPLHSPFYVRRQADTEIQRQVELTGTTSVVKGPRQIGKSSLLVRALAQARSKGHKTCFLDFQMIDATQAATLDTLLKHLARKMAREFRTTLKPDDQWDSNLGPIDNLTIFLEDAILSDTEHPVLLVLDEADQVFGFPYRDDFFSCLRAWHNNRATNGLWANLSLIVSHSTEPYLWIKDLNRSPFNVGFVIRLEDFTLNQLGDLNRAYETPLKTEADVKAIYDLVGGHPYLIRQALYILQNRNCPLSELRRTAVSDTGPFGDHLRRWVWHLQNNKELKEELRQVFQQGTCQDEMSFQRLRAAGLIVGDSRNTSQIRCRLYHEYFSNHL